MANKPECSLVVANKIYFFPQIFFFFINDHLTCPILYAPLPWPSIEQTYFSSHRVTSSVEMWSHVAQTSYIYKTEAHLCFCKCASVRQLLHETLELSVVDVASSRDEEHSLVFNISPLQPKWMPWHQLSYLYSFIKRVKAWVWVK